MVGTGAVGARAARQLVSCEALDQLAVIDANPAQAQAVAASLGSPAVATEWEAVALERGDVVVLAAPGPHADTARSVVAAGASVVSVADAIDDVRDLLQLDAAARAQGVGVVVGAGFTPGLSCILARHAAAGFDSVDEVHVAKAGTGGPSCARQHHHALTAEALDWQDGEWVARRGGSGRALCWFPDPLGALDCYRGGLPDPLLLVRAFPGVARVSARMAASRRDRLTARFPMLRQPHPEGLLGATRVEVRGRRGAATDVKVLGVLDRPAIAAGMVAGVLAIWALEGQLSGPGAGGVAEMVTDPVPILHDLARRGVRAAAFEGSTALVPPGR